MAKRRSRKTTAETTAPVVEVGALVEQPNGGALRHGGPNVGGPGRPPSAIRLTCRESFASRVAILEQIADGEPMVKLMAPDGTTELGKISATPSDRIKAIDTLGKYGGIEKLTIDDGSARGTLAHVSDEELLRTLAARAKRLSSDRARRQALLAAGVHFEPVP